MKLPGLTSGRGDVGGFHNDAGTHLVGVTGGSGHERVLAVGWRPAVGVVADERRRVSRAGDLEVGLTGTDEGGHARKRTSGDPED